MMTEIPTDEGQCLRACRNPPPAFTEGWQRLVRRWELSDCDELYDVAHNHTQLLHFQSAI